MVITKTHYNQAGMATLEILIALAIVAMSIMTVLPLLAGSQSILVDSQTNQEALYKARDLLEIARATAHVNFNDIETSTTDGMYTTQTIVDQASVTECAQNVKGIVSWNIDSRSLTAELITHLTNVSLARDLAGDCAFEPPAGGWGFPNTLNSADTAPAGIQGTDINVENKIVYMSADPSAAADPDFFVFDATNASPTVAPILAASLNTGPGLAGIDVAGSYAYVANDSKNGQLQIIDISDPFSLDIGDIRTFNVEPGGTDNNTVGKSIFYDNSKIYLGLTKNTYQEFYVIDVSGFTPSVLGSYEVDAGVNAIYVRGDYAYIVTPNNEELTIIDVNPSSTTYMQRVGGFDAPLGSGNGKSIRAGGNRLYLGRTQGGTEFYILDISTPTNPTPLGSYNVNASINDLMVIGKYAFLVTSEANLEFQVLDVLDPNDIQPLGKYNYSEHGTGIDYENSDGWVYVSNESQDALRIIRPAECADKIDDESIPDGFIDAADPQCHSDGNANNSASYNPDDDNETS